MRLPSKHHPASCAPPALRCNRTSFPRVRTHPHQCRAAGPSRSKIIPSGCWPPRARSCSTTPPTPPPSSTHRHGHYHCHRLRLRLRLRLRKMLCSSSPSSFRTHRARWSCRRTPWDLWPLCRSGWWRSRAISAFCNPNRRTRDRPNPSTPLLRWRTRRWRGRRWRSSGARCRRPSSSTSCATSRQETPSTCRRWSGRPSSSLSSYCNRTPRWRWRGLARTSGSSSPSGIRSTPPFAAYRSASGPSGSRTCTHLLILAAWFTSSPSNTHHGPHEELASEEETEPRAMPVDARTRDSHLLDAGRALYALPRSIMSA
mmetsp:Transcript_25995/g.65885  ORF Transcript_25995/g.65885 Transcript_25995/m.65885 type:complete len:314 (-) Transcript_25995:208-1149(-)